MRTLLKILLGSLLLVLLVALGTEVVALHRIALPNQSVSPVVVRKSTTAPMPPKTVRPVVTHHPPPAKPRKTALPVHNKAPAN
ncbi:MAG: hypothetical protein JWP58_1963 [Hymenobacter sp.]|nr:hypothetical protein [Hymenobacter sp.]